MQKKIFKLVILILWMVLIFFFSSQLGDETNSLSMAVTKTIWGNHLAVQLGIDQWMEDVAGWNHFMRKLAHFILYFVLGILVCFYMLRGRKQIGIGRVILAWVLCIVYAASDEMHQIFVSGREPSIFDVMLDSGGSLLGIVCFISVFMVYRRYRLDQSQS